MKTLFRLLVFFIVLSLGDKALASTHHFNVHPSKSAVNVPISDSGYVVHASVDTTAGSGTYTIYLYVTAAGNPTHLTVPVDFSATATIYSGTVYQQTNTITIYTGYDYGSLTFSTPGLPPPAFTNVMLSIYYYNGQPVTYDPNVTYF